MSEVIENNENNLEECKNDSAINGFNKNKIEADVEIQINNVPCSSDNNLNNSPKHLDNGLTSIFNHPAYKTAIKEILSLKEENDSLKCEQTRLEKENELLKSDKSEEIYKIQIETLEKTVAEQAKEIEAAKIEAFKQEEAAVATIASTKIQLEKVRKEYNEANRERESTVVRYAVSEREREKIKSEVQNLEKRLHESGKERDSLLIKLKACTSEKQKVCQLLDVKTTELTNSLRDVEKLKDEINSREVKIKWAQNKAKSEIDANKEYQQKIEKLNAKVQEQRDEIENIKKECQTILKSHHQGNVDRTSILESQVQELKALLITEKQMHADTEDLKRMAVNENEHLKSKQNIIIDDNLGLIAKVRDYEIDRKNTEARLATFQSSEERRCKLEADIEGLTLQLKQYETKESNLQEEYDSMKIKCKELTLDTQAAKEKEAELLIYTQQLTDKVVKLQSENCALEARASQAECERDPLLKRFEELNNKIKELETQLNNEIEGRLKENQILSRKLAEKQEYAEKLSRQLEESQGEYAVLKKKQAQATKELTREVQNCRRKLQQVELSSGNISQNSRNGSQTSLNQVEGAESSQAALDPQLLISHIGKLQRKASKQQEKIEFMEEHNKTLLNELQRKTKLVQDLILKEQGGALSSRASDRSKMELVKHGGVMASLYSAAPTDDTMTLELSLEINKKLQAVLEDTLLKNITLKENMDTLGQEIERLSKCTKKPPEKY